MENTTIEKEPFVHGDLTYKLIGIGMEIHRILGYGLAEVVYKDAFEYELKQQHIPYEREVKYEVVYKGIVLPHYYFADFVINNEVILEAKAQAGIHEQAVPQVINYLAISKLPVGLLLNFGEGSLRYKRLAFTRKKAA